MENQTLNVSKAQKKQKNKGAVKSSQSSQANSQAVCGAMPQAQGQQAQASKPQGV